MCSHINKLDSTHIYIHVQTQLNSIFELSCGQSFNICDQGLGLESVPYP